MDDINFIGDVVVSTATIAWNKVKEYYKDNSVKNDIDYGFAYENYLFNTKQKYSKVKTLIYRHTPKDLYSFYESCNLRYENSVINTININNIIDRFSKVIITGTGGIGKTTLLRHLFLNAIQETNFVPVFVELRYINDKDNVSLYDLIYENLKDNGFELEDKYFEYSLKQGAYIFLLDGFDEVKVDKKHLVQKCIQSFSDKYRDNKFIITSRPMDELISLSNFVELQSMSLSKKQALSLVSKIEFDEHTKVKFSEELDMRLYVKYRSFASNPLLLTIMLLTFEAHASIPNNLKDFYEQAFMTLFNMHDATKLGYERDIKSKLGYNDFKTIFSYICFKSFFNGEYQFSYEKLREYISIARVKFKEIKFSEDDYLDDLKISVCMIIKDGNEYVFTHRTFQEYFAAVYTCQLTDDKQKKLLKFYLEDKNVTNNNDEYIKMLLSMQNEKFISIILVPEIRNLKRIYDEYGFSYELLSKLFIGVKINMMISSDNKERYSLVLQIKDKYMCNIVGISMGLKNNNHIIRSESNKVALELIKMKEDEIIMINDKFRFLMIDWDFISSTDLKTQVLEEFKWFNKQLLDSFALLDEYGIEVSSRKKTLKSFLDTL